MFATLLISSSGLPRRSFSTSLTLRWHSSLDEKTIQTYIVFMTRIAIFASNPTGLDLARSHQMP